MSITLVVPEGEFFEALRAAPPPYRALIKAEFERRVAAGLPVAGRAGVIDLDPASRQEMTPAVLMATLGAWPAGGFWRLRDNTSLRLTGPQVIAMATAAGAYYQALFAARSTLLDAEAAGGTPDPTKGWPDPLPFSPGAEQVALPAPAATEDVG